MLPCILDHFSPNLPFFLRQFLLKFTEQLLACNTRGKSVTSLLWVCLQWRLVRLGLLGILGFTAGTWGCWGLLGGSGLLWAAGAHFFTYWGTKLVQLLRFFPLCHFYFAVCGERSMEPVIFTAFRGVIQHKTFPAIHWRLCCLYAEGTGIIKPLERAEKVRFVLLDSGAFCE